MSLLGEVARSSSEREDEEGYHFLVVGTLNEDLLGSIGGAEVWPLKAEPVLVRNGYSDRAMNWLKRDRKRLYGRDSWRVGEQGVVAGVSVVYEK